MTAPFTGNRPQPGLPNLPEPPSGWPIGSYAKYEEAQRAVDHLADNDFPVADVTIVGVDLMLVERVLGRLTWGRVLATGAASGAWLGLFFGILLALLGVGGTAGSGLVAVLVGLGLGIVFGVISGALTYGASRGRRDFTSASQLVAGRYDVLCQPRNAEKGKEMLGRLALASEQ